MYDPEIGAVLCFPSIKTRTCSSSCNWGSWGSCECP
jgi:hypothetical protein